MTTHGVTGDDDSRTDSSIDTETETETESSLQEIAADLEANAEDDADQDVDASIQEIAADLSKFQVRCLATLAQQDRYGLGLKREVETYYGEEQNHGRLYPNLNDLEEDGLIEISELDKRTNNYSITSTGEAVLEYELGWLEDQINGDGGDA